MRIQIIQVQFEYDQSRVSMFQRALSGPFRVITVIVGGFIRTVVAFFSGGRRWVFELIQFCFPSSLIEYCGRCHCPFNMLLVSRSYIFFVLGPLISADAFRYKCFHQRYRGQR